MPQIKQVDPATGRVVRIFETIPDACYASNLRFLDIHSCLHNHQAVAGGYDWQYVDRSETQETLHAPDEQVNTSAIARHGIDTGHSAAANVNASTRGGHRGSRVRTSTKTNAATSSKVPDHPAKKRVKKKATTLVWAGDAAKCSFRNRKRAFRPWPNGWKIEVHRRLKGSQKNQLYFIYIHKQNNWRCRSMVEVKKAIIG
jgi:hypothetical protein